MVEQNKDTKIMAAKNKVARNMVGKNMVENFKDAKNKVAKNMVVKNPSCENHVWNKQVQLKHGHTK